MNTYSVTINLNVLDERELLRTAQERARENASEDDVRDMLQYEDGSVNVSNCLLMLLDPGTLDGCEILGSDADSVA